MAKGFSKKGFNKTFVYLQLHGVVRGMNKKKTPEIIKEELLASIFEVFEEEEDYLHINEEGAEELRDSIFSKKV